MASCTLLLWNQTALRNQAKYVHLCEQLNAATVCIPTSHLRAWKPCGSREYRPHWMIQMLILAEFRLSLKLHFYSLLKCIRVWGYCNFSILWMRMRSCEYIKSKSSYYLQNLKCREINKEIQFLTGPLYVVSLAQVSRFFYMAGAWVDFGKFHIEVSSFIFNQLKILFPFLVLISRSGGWMYMN